MDKGLRRWSGRATVPKKRYSPREIEILKKLKALRAGGPGEDPDLESLPELPELPTGEATVAMFIPGAETNPDASNDESQDEELVEDESMDDE